MPIDQERARRVIAQCLAVDEDRVIDSARLVEDLDADSLEIAEIGISLDDEFDVYIPDDVVAKWRTVGDVLRAVAHSGGTGT